MLAAARKLPPALPGEIERARLDNGLEVCLLRNRQAPIVSSALVYRAGARDEAEGASGLAHFLEHMMFKGSARYGPGEVDRRTQELGGANNAFTSHDVTAYWFSFAADRWGEALGIEADRMRGLRLEPREVASERKVILEEIAMYRDDPWDALEMEALAALFPGHPYGRPVIGCEADLARAGRDELAAFHHRHYRPDRALLVVAGDLDEGALRRIEDAFGGVPAGGEPRAVLAPPGPASGERRVERRQGELTRLLLLTPAPPADSPGHAELRIAACLLTEGRSSRLQRALVEEGQLCLEVSAALAESELASFFALSAELLPGVEAAEVEPRLRAELARLAAEPVGEAELERARRLFVADWVNGQERIHQQAVVAGLAGAQFDLGQPARLLARAVGAEPGAIRDAAARWLDPAADGVVAICRPAGAPGSAPVA
jgi:zinc protease